jgi:glycosyltransferase involved in cell wall biosynthesis
LRVLHLNDHAVVKGGVESYLHRLLPRLKKAGDEVLLAHGVGEAVDFLPCVELKGLSSPYRRDEKSVAERLHSVIRDFRPDRIHIHNSYNPAAIRISVALVPTILHLHDYRYICPASSFYFRRAKRSCGLSCSAACFAIGPVLGCQTPRPAEALGFYRRVQTVKELVPRFHAVLANSNYVRDRFLMGTEHGGNVSTLHYFVEEVSVPEAAGESAQESDETHPYVLFVGRVREDKGVFDFIRAVAKMRGIRGKIIGAKDDESSNRIHDCAVKAGCGDRIDIEGWMSRDEVRLAMRRAVAVIFPSRWQEPFGLVGVEAMLQQTPVIATRVGGVPDWLEDRENGFLVEVGDTKAIAERAMQIAGDDALRSRMGERGLQLCRERFGIDEHIAILRASYQGI